MSKSSHKIKEVPVDARPDVAGITAKRIGIVKAAYVGEVVKNQRRAQQAAIS